MFQHKRRPASGVFDYEAWKPFTELKDLKSWKNWGMPCSSTITLPKFSPETPLKSYSTEPQFRKGSLSSNAIIFQGFSLAVKLRGGYMGVSKNNGTPQIMNFNRVFHCKPSILGENHLETPICTGKCHEAQDVISLCLVSICLVHQLWMPTM